MTQLVEIDRYVESPIGRAVAGEHLLCWYLDPTLRCTSVWGAPNVADIELLIQAVSVEIRDDSPRHSSLVDLRRMTSDVDAAAYEMLVEFVAHNRYRFAATIIQSVVLHQGGLQAALVGGYTRVAGEPFPVSLHQCPAEALAALGRDGGRLFDELDAVTEMARARAPTLWRVRAWIHANIADATLPRCADALASSTRTLQRRLRQARTSFRQELERARIDRAKRVLAATDDKVLAVALSVGYPKVQNLVTPFRRHTGLSPTEWRHRNAK